MTHHRWLLILAGLLVAAPADAQRGAPGPQSSPRLAGHSGDATPTIRVWALAAARRDLLRLRRGVRRLDLQVRGSARRFERLAANEVTEIFSRTVRLPRNGTLDLQNFSGDVVVTGSGGDQVRIEAVKRVRPREAAQAQALLAEVTVAVAERGDRVEVRTESPRRRGWPGVVDFTVSVPADAHVSLRSATGRLHVSRVNGDLRLQTISGDITATDVQGLNRIRSVSGGIEIRNAAGSEVTGGTVSGRVSISGLKTRSLELQSVSGDFLLGDAEVERVFVRSVSGDIEYGGTLARSGRYELRTHSGDVRVTPRGASGFHLDAATFSGDVRSDFELAVTSVGPATPGRGLRAGGPSQARRLLGTSAGGGALLLVQSFSGDIVVAK